MNLKNKKDYIILVGVIIFQLLLYMFHYMYVGKYEMQLEYASEKYEQVEVVKKQKSKGHSVGHKGLGGYSTYYDVSFRFSDGSIRGFLVDDSSRGSSVYDFMQEGDMGTLSYKELDNHTWRQFLSFERSPAYGGGKVETGLYIAPKGSTLRTIIGLVVINLLAFLGVVYSKKIGGKPTRSKMDKTKQVEVAGKRIVKYKGTKTGGYAISHTYIVSFRFPNGSVKEFEVGMNYSTKGERPKEFQCEAYDAVHKGDVGILAYQVIKHTEMFATKSLKFISFTKAPPSEATD